MFRRTLRPDVTLEIKCVQSKPKETDSYRRPSVSPEGTVAIQLRWSPDTGITAKLSRDDKPLAWRSLWSANGWRVKESQGRGGPRKGRRKGQPLHCVLHLLPLISSHAAVEAGACWCCLTRGWQSPGFASWQGTFSCSVPRAAGGCISHSSSHSYRQWGENHRITKNEKELKKSFSSPFSPPFKGRIKLKSTYNRCLPPCP